MQHYTIKMSALAEEDLENAGDYIAFILLNPSAAENTVKGIRSQVNTLQQFPDRHELDDDPVLEKLGVHKTYYKEYKIFYVIDHDTNIVHVIRILHMRVDSKVWLYRTLGVPSQDV
jgi:plasmid stabilization system protein ParE